MGKKSVKVIMNPFIDWEKEELLYKGYDWKSLSRGADKVVEYINNEKYVDEVVLNIGHIKDYVGLRLNTSVYKILRELTRKGFIELKRGRSYYVNPKLIKCVPAHIIGKYMGVLKRDYPEVYIKLKNKK